MKTKIKEYIVGLVLNFLWYFLLMSIVGVILIFVINPVFVFFRFGKIVLIPDFDYVLTIIKMTLFSSLSVSFVVFNLHVFGLYDDGSDKFEK